MPISCSSHQRDYLYFFSRASHWASFFQPPAKLWVIESSAKEDAGAEVRPSTLRIAMTVDMELVLCIEKRSDADIVDIPRVQSATLMRSSDFRSCKSLGISYPY